MHRLLRLKKALKAAVHGAAFDSVAKNARVVLAVEDIEECFLEGNILPFESCFPCTEGLTIL